ncbi:hypothetical protein D3C72_128710 [compost metagenome]
MYRPPMRFRALLLTAILIWHFPESAHAQATLLPRLEALGFENLALEGGGETLTLWYENRRYFLEIEAMGRVLAEASRDLEANQVIAVVPQRDRIPLMIVRMSVGDLREFLAGDMTPDSFRKRLAIEPPPAQRPEHRLNPSLYRTDLDLTPGYFFSVEFKGWVNGTVRTPIANGLAATARGRYYLVPWGETGVTFAQIQGHNWLLPGVMGSWVAGRWSETNYGAHGEIASQLDEGNWIWRLSGGAGSGMAPLAATSLERRFHPLDVVLSGGVGLFQGGDRAVFARFIRWFPRSAVEGSVWRSDLGTQLRMGLSIYLGPNPLPKPGPLRVFAPGLFMTDYRASSPPSASMPFPEADVDRIWQRLTPSYVRAHVEDWRSHRSMGSKP